MEMVYVGIHLVLLQNVPYQAETVEHIISGCQTLAADKYLNRHNQVAAQLHLDLCKHYAIKSGCITLVPTQSRTSNGE